jgi:hypothetical protein
MKKSERFSISCFNKQTNILTISIDVCGSDVNIKDEMKICGRLSGIEFFGYLIKGIVRNVKRS